MNGATLATRIDNAFLKFDEQSSVEALKRSIDQTISYGLRSLCTTPQLAGTVKQNYPHLRVSAVVSYPLGADLLPLKLEACRMLIEQGIDELDVVYDLFALINDNSRKIELEARELGELTASRGVLHKAIIETPILSEAQISRASHALLESPVDCIKTSTGYGREPTRSEHVRLIRSVVGQSKLVKASGGIRGLDDARRMIEAGADILGTSSGAAIIDEARRLAQQA
jgi:deoxyribose-phosphate aldolase